MLSLKKVKIKNKRVLVRVDFNVPLKKGRVADAKRIEAALPTIKYILSKKPKQIILMSHLGRPGGKVVNALRMDPVAKVLERMLGRRVKKLDDCVDIEIPEDKIILLENLRFHKEEKRNKRRFAKKLASYADVYINDAFGSAHRAHASVEAVTRFLPSAAGFLLQKEVDVIGKALSKPKRPFVAIIGGIKVADKIGIIKNLLKKVDALLIGGAMMFTFYKSVGKEIGKSHVEEDRLALARKLIKNSKLMLPVDVIVADKISSGAKTRIVDIDAIPKKSIGVDIGPETLAVYQTVISKANTLIWNGPMGIFEIPKFAKGTRGLAQALAHNKKAVTIIGGGDSVAAIEKLELKLTHVSTGGGASLEFLAGKKLPALKALERNYKKFR